MNTRKIVLVLCVLLFSSFLAYPAFSQPYIPKIDNFIFLYDGSGSMKRDYMDTAKDKAALAKIAMGAMNSDIPGLEYQSGLVELTPSFMVYQDMKTYNSKDLEYAVARLPEPDRIFGLSTPLERGFKKLETILSDLSGRTALILFSDGGENMFSDALPVVKSLYANYDVCFHVVSYAQSTSERALLEKIASLNDCSYMISGMDIRQAAKRRDYVQNIFYEKGKDSDGDGVWDSKDECPQTPAGVEVDPYGCPLDSDKDGVYDYLDKCPDTPMNVEVDKDGCPLDSDGDGVYDYLDECPNTAKGLVVNDQGCPIEQELRLKILFDFDKAEIKPEYRTELRRVATYLANHPDGKVKVEGHTDSVGSAEYNKELSQRRANSVKEYLIREFGVKENRLEARGYGEEEPVASNETEQGRQKNRRVVCILPEVYKQK